MGDLDVSTIEALADWVEASVLVSASGHLSREMLLVLATEELGIEPPRIAMALAVMGRRQAVLGDAYPFRVNEFAVLRRAEEAVGTYSTLLHLTPGSVARQTVRAGEIAVMGELLEEVAEVGLANLWGPGGTALRFAYPSRHARPEKFDAAVRWLAERIGVDAGSGYRPPRRKDGGVDVVAWRRFADQRPGFPIALAQCTIQAESFSKSADIDLRLWASWLAMDMDPLSVLVFPGTVKSAGPDWSQLVTVVLPIDRLRLTELVARNPHHTVRPSWTDATNIALGGVLGASEI